MAELLGPLCDGWHWRRQQAVTLTDSEPEPDVVIAKGSPRDYVVRHPGARDVGLLVEVCASSQYRDRVQKKRIYSRAGIEPYWIVDVDNRRIEVYTRPDGLGDYAAVEVVEPGGWADVVVGGHLAGRLAVNDILPTAAVPQ